MTCRKTPKILSCAPEPETPEKVYAPFTVCLPLVGTLNYDGRGLTCIKEDIPDGTYGQFTVTDGCVTHIAALPVFIYTPPPCAPAAVPCSGDGGGSGGGLTVSPGADNLTSLSNGQLLTKLHVQNSGAAQIDGDGTLASPLRVSVTVPDTSVKLDVDPAFLSLTGTGAAASPYRIAHKTPSGIGGSNYGGFTLDNAGHVTGFDSSAAGIGIVSVTGVAGTVDVKSEGKAVVIGLPEKFDKAQIFEMAGARLTVDIYGRLAKIETTNEDAAAAGSYSRLFQGSRTLSAFQFDSPVGGLIRGSYSGRLDGTVTGSGLLPLPGGIRVLVDEVSVQAFARVINNVIAGLEFLTPASYASGVHSVAVSTDTAMDYTGILDVTVCL